MSELWQAMRISLLIASLSTVSVAVIGVGLAYLSSRLSFPGKSILEAILLLPLVLPPTVVGYFIIVLFGKHGVVGGSLARWTDGYTILFRIEGATVAAAVVSLPLLYLPAKAAFGGVDQDLEAVARLFGATRLQTFWHVSLPLARGGIASGLLLAFGRAIGEFGATSMVMGNFAGRQTLPMFIYSQTIDGSINHAAMAVWMLSGLSMLIVVLYNRSSPVRERHH